MQPFPALQLHTPTKNLKPSSFVLDPTPSSLLLERLHHIHQSLLERLNHIHQSLLERLNHIHQSLLERLNHIHQSLLERLNHIHQSLLERLNHIHQSLLERLNHIHQSLLERLNHIHQSLLRITEVPLLSGHLTKSIQTTIVGLLTRSSIDAYKLENYSPLSSLSSICKILKLYSNSYYIVSPKSMFSIILCTFLSIPQRQCFHKMENDILLAVNKELLSLLTLFYYGISCN